MIPTQSYAEVYDRYAAAIEWMQGLGIRITPGRTAHYAKVTEHWRDAYQLASEEEASAGFPGFVSSMLEVQDFIEVHEAFNRERPDQLASIKKKLEKGGSPALPVGRRLAAKRAMVRSDGYKRVLFRRNGVRRAEDGVIRAA